MIKISIIILLKNGERYLPDILNAVFKQEINEQFEVICIDSGSSDKTLEIISSYCVRMYQIKPIDFNHGETRNLGGKLSSEDSTFLVYLSQDAIPADKYWLKNLIEPMIKDDLVAGCFSRHIPRETSSPSLVRQLLYYWQTGGKQRIVKQFPSSEEEFYKNRTYYNTFSNTSSAIRKSVWKHIPFSKVTFAEDALWADQVLRQGYKIVYEPSSCVIHSHDYPIIEQFRQNVDHAFAMKKLFNPPDYSKRSYWVRLLFSIPIQIWRDWFFIYNHEPFKSYSYGRKIYFQYHSICWHFASALGTIVGANYEKIPSSLRIIFSRQEILRLK